MCFGRIQINTFLLLCDLSFEMGLISRKRNKERLIYLGKLSEGRYLYQRDFMRRKNVNNVLEDVVKNYGYEDDYGRNHSNAFEVIESSNEEPNKFSLITVNSGNFGKWKIAAISDPDPFPSIPHFHGVGEYRKFKLDPYTGKVYEGKELVGKESIPIIRGMWQHDGFRQIAKKAMNSFSNEQNPEVIERYLKRRGITKEQMGRMPRRRKNSERVF